MRADEGTEEEGSREERGVDGGWRRSERGGGLGFQVGGDEEGRGGLVE